MKVAGFMGLFNDFGLQAVPACVLWLQERERLKQEKRDEKRLNKERKLELRRLELEMVKELNKPIEDLCLPDQKVFVPTSFSACLKILHFSYFMTGVSLSWEFLFSFFISMHV